MNNRLHIITLTGSQLDAIKPHLLVFTFEYEMKKQLVSADRSYCSIEALSRHNYCWIYKTVLNDTTRILHFFLDHDTWPEALQAKPHLGV